MGIIINVMMRHVVTAYICNHAMIWQGFLTRDLIYSTYFFLVIVSWFLIEISFFMHEHISYKNIINKTLYPMFLKMFNGFDNFMKWYITEILVMCVQLKTSWVKHTINRWLLLLSYAMRIITRRIVLSISINLNEYYDYFISNIQLNSNKVFLGNI